MLRATLKILLMFVLSLLLVTVAFVGGFATSRALVKPATTSQTNDGSPPLPCCATVTVPNNRSVALGLI